MSEKSLLEFAYDVIYASKEPMPFKEVFEKALELSKRQLSELETRKAMASLYTQLSVDGRFACFAGNIWDLRSKHVYSDTYINIDEFNDADDSESDDEEEKKLLQQELGEEEIIDEDKELSEEDNDRGELDEI